MAYRNGNYCAFYVAEPFEASPLSAHASKDFVYYNTLRMWKGADTGFPFVDSHDKNYNVGDGSDWDKLPMLRDSMNSVPTLHIQMKKDIIKMALEDKELMLNSKVASGSEHKELNFLCDRLDLAEYFLSINGSPTPKNDLVKNLLENEQYKKEETILIGDSINDYDAAQVNGIEFYGYNNIDLKSQNKYIIEFKEFIFNE